MSGNVYRFIFAAGGTGGHLYPAVAVAEKLKELKPESKILFVGTKNKIESRVIPKLGYDFKSIWISGFSRKLTLANLLFPVKLLVSLLQSFLINLNFKPSVVIGAGAYVSGPIVWIGTKLGSKSVLLEQNSYPGVTNRMLENKVNSIHISFEDSDKYFKQKSKLKLSGNPVRTTLKLIERNTAIENYGLDKDKKVLLVIGGSLGARTINNAIAKNLELFINKNIQVIWQTGEIYYNEFRNYKNQNVIIMPFISDMQKAYSACDLMIARAGATTIAEVSHLGLPAIFVPSVNVAANHQFKNAKSLVDQNAGLLIEDYELSDKILETVLNTIYNNELLLTLKENIKKLSKPNAAKVIAEDILQLAENKNLN
ncbi:MAG: undecaprenyldiphospho-muramoylpentapeptide beta-N-acetylglucosaminyltransferase [Ignavibacteriae bacterium]|nr:undecaprenyldiphospho-muramoylpentapeptide beta-N-acetylglucosaminyltransferase [Ignavibacteriota bacterium]MCB9219736.1 undecaprenyldiphospho-muramoylpentapeptide beta-N-acetylglucosaminyltransferase [Ignavibacteriales bacterium]